MLTRNVYKYPKLVVKSDCFIGSLYSYTFFIFLINVLNIKPKANPGITPNIGSQTGPNNIPNSLKVDE